MNARAAMAPCPHACNERGVLSPTPPPCGGGGMWGRRGWAELIPPCITPSPGTSGAAPVARRGGGGEGGVRGSNDPPLMFCISVQLPVQNPSLPRAGVKTTHTFGIAFLRFVVSELRWIVLSGLPAALQERAAHLEEKKQKPKEKIKGKKKEKKKKGGFFPLTVMTFWWRDCQEK